MLKRVARLLPARWQHELKRLHYARAVRRGSIRTDWEPEFLVLHEFVSAGDWVIDVGANIGHYTARLGSLVGATGRVIAVEPVPETFAYLTSAVRGLDNVTLLCVAATSEPRQVGITVPRARGATDHYSARVSGAGEAVDATALGVPLDALALPQRVALVKIDTEGHELAVLEGMPNLLARDRPALIVEDNDPAVPAHLARLGYRSHKYPGSSNVCYFHPEGGRGVPGVAAG